MRREFYSSAALKSVRGKLKRKFAFADNEGLFYQDVFGCSFEKAGHLPHVGVRVELRWVERSYPKVPLYKFHVFVDFNFPASTDLETAQHLRKAVMQAVTRAKWAQELVGRYGWRRDAVAEGLDG
jgi:hypothetical protein